MTVFKRWAALCALLAVAMLLSGCQMPRIFPASADRTAEPVSTAMLCTPTPMPEIDAEPAGLITRVETDQKVICLIFEGYTDESTVSAIADALAQRSVPTTFFLSGVTADEHPAMLQELVSKGFDIGNYGMSGAKGLERYPAYKNAEWFSHTQRLIRASCGADPEYVRCNGTEYTDDVLRAVAAGGLKAAVKPSAYVNHRSFGTAEAAQNYAASVLRGSILTFKLGQELDDDEYGDIGDKLNERPAIDPSPGIRRNWESTEERFIALPEQVGWLVDALKAQQYTFVTLDKLQSYEKTLLPKARELTPQERDELSPAAYAFPVTLEPLTAGNVATSDLDGAVFVGDSVMGGLRDYVEWRRKVKPEYLSGVAFVIRDHATIESLLDDASGEPRIEDELASLNPRSVWLCLGFTSVDGYKHEAYLANYRLLIHRITQACPSVRVVVMSVPPKLEGYAGISNSQRFRLNLMLCGMCREYGIGFVDCAYAVRDETGALRREYCLDSVTYGCHLNDVGCETLLAFIQQHAPI